LHVPFIDLAQRQPAFIERPIPTSPVVSVPATPPIDGRELPTRRLASDLTQTSESPSHAEAFFR